MLAFYLAIFISSIIDIPRFKSKGSFIFGGEKGCEFINIEGFVAKLL
jgi:hypothetical protein